MDGKIRAWDLTTRKQLARLTGSYSRHTAGLLTSHFTNHGRGIFTGGVYSVAVGSREGTPIVVSGGQGGAVWVNGSTRHSPPSPELSTRWR
ncbi:hypothetical protein ACIBG8_14540 [Nonomuraea sp. NPDC050556]|uniref:hypothetical protein n=1 Tax=Nonomuraea sp. NPDC050556 TaxID=3364369 RepID=UPI00379E53A0